MAADGKSFVANDPTTLPNPAPIVNNGAIVPPEVPLASETDQEISFVTHRTATNEVVQPGSLEMVAVIFR
jgi:hypothetical protein